MKVLVIGGSRFIGLHLVRLLHSRGHEVSVLNRGQTPADLPDGVTRMHADRTEPTQVRAVLKDEYDVAFDTSCYTTDALQPVVDCLRGRVGHFLFCSTTSVYAPTDLAPIEEDFPLSRDEVAGDYARNKVRCEDMLMEESGKNGFPATVIRPPVVYGPDNYIPEREFSFFARLQRQRPIIMPGDGNVFFHSVHVGDLAAAFVAAVGRKSTFGQAYTACGPHAITGNGWVSVVGEAMGVVPEIVHVSPERYEAMHRELGIAEVYPFEWTRSRVYLNGKAGRELEWSPGYKMADGMAVTYEWWRRRGLYKVERDFSAEDRALEWLGRQSGKKPRNL